MLPEMVNKGSMRKYLWISLLVIVADQLTKAMAEQWLQFRQPVTVLPYFEWYLSYNTGAAFSFLASAGGWQRWFLSLIAIVVSVVLAIWISRLKHEERLTAMALALILGGAIGNLIDRLLYGHVIDFIQVWLGTYPWPAFNIADSAISIGAVLLITHGMFSSYREPRLDNQP
jgi:signal peptidase II